MEDGILHSALVTLRSVLAAVVNLSLARAAAMVADFSETKRICHKRNRQIEKQGKTKDPANNKMVERVPIKVSHKQL